MNASPVRRVVAYQRLENGRNLDGQEQAEFTGTDCTWLKWPEEEVRDTHLPGPSGSSWPAQLQAREGRPGGGLEAGTPSGSLSFKCKFQILSCSCICTHMDVIVECIA